MMRVVRLAFVVACAAIAGACQSPTSASSTMDVDDFVDASISPNPATATISSGKTYRVVRGNNQPDDVLPYQYTSTFTITLTINSNATSSDLDLSFPFTILSAAGKVEQAAGGIVTPPTGGEVEHYESVILSSTSASIPAVGGGTTMVFQVWYSLPSGNREATVTETIAMKDDDGTTFSKNVSVNIAP